MQFQGQGILLDIEGTTSSIRFVYDEMFPFVRRELDRYLREHWASDELSSACDAIARDAGRATFREWAAGADESTARARLADHVRQLMDDDVKATGLKQLQGLIWKAGFESGELQAHVYPDVPPALRAWNDARIDVRIYSSGSVQAQRLFFGHSIAGDLLPCFRGHYDTTMGGKKDAASYTAIAAEFGLDPRQILFVSDVAAELQAARDAGLQTALSVRPGNPEQPAGHGFTIIHDFGEIRIR